MIIFISVLLTILAVMALVIAAQYVEIRATQRHLERVRIQRDEARKSAEDWRERHLRQLNQRMAGYTLNQADPAHLQHPAYGQPLSVINGGE